MKWIVLTLCFPGLALAQTAAQRDSLLGLARTAASDTARVWALMEAGKLYLNTQPDTALLYLEQALALAE